MRLPKVAVISVVLAIVLAGAGYWYWSKYNDEVKEKESTVLYEKNVVPLYDFSNIAVKNGVSVDVPWKPIDVKPKLAPYSVAANLSGVENLAQFGELTPKQKELLTKNLFFVSGSDQQQLFYIYEKNEYLKIPSFISVDSVLQVYHMFFDYSLRTIENEKLMPVLQSLTDGMVTKSMEQYLKAKEPVVKQAALKNVAFFSVASNILGGKTDSSKMPEASTVQSIVNKELELINGSKGFADSAIFPFKLDYSQYVPRGHYTKNENLKKYFKAMMWYGQVGFPAKKEKMEQVVQSLLMTTAIAMDKDSEILASWENIYKTTTFYVGESDDITLYQIKAIIQDVFGETPDINAFSNPTKIDTVLAYFKTLPEPKILNQFIDPKVESGKGFRFMGQRYIPDSEIMQKLTNVPARLFPKGLDVAAALGSDRAQDILLNVYNENKAWPEYSAKLERLKSDFSKLPDDKWRSNMYYGWIWNLKSLFGTFESGYPSFMQNSAWQDKSINSAMASWAELRHDTILYAKQSAAECGDGVEPPVVKGYVEPNVELYEKLLWLTDYSRKNLSARKLITETLDGKMANFEEMLNFLIKCSVKELNNEELTKEEYAQIRIFGGTLEGLTISTVDGAYKWYQIENETDRNMAVVADVHTVPGNYLEEGVGYANEIYVVVPIGGKLYLTRGATFSYYEFVSPKRLTDEQWQTMLKEKKQPEIPEWTKSFMGDGKKEIPAPAEPYSSGC